MNWKSVFAKWKFNYDISSSFLGLINFVLLSITASQPIRDFFNSRLGVRLDQFVIVGVLCLGLLVMFLLFGLFLDKVFQYWENLMTIQNQKNPQLSEILDNTRKILNKK
jgi:predicted PurR-regulated permease PerM